VQPCLKGNTKGTNSDGKANKINKKKAKEETAGHAPKPQRTKLQNVFYLAAALSQIFLLLLLTAYSSKSGDYD